MREHHLKMREHHPRRVSRRDVDDVVDNCLRACASARKDELRGRGLGGTVRIGGFRCTSIPHLMPSVLYGKAGG